MPLFRRKSSSAEPPVSRPYQEPAPVRLFLYFNTEQPAREAATTLADKGYGVQLGAPTEEVTEWSVVAEGDPDTEDVGEADDALEAWASSLGGEYDGHEILLNP